MRLVAFCMCCLVILASCSKANLTYLSDLKEQEAFESDLSAANEPVIQPGDLLRVSMSSQNPESNALFNSGLIMTGGSGRNADPNSILVGSNANDGYLVDKNGFVNFPFIGNVNLNGLTKEEASEKVTEILKKYVKQPVINVRIINFKVTVLGEVNRPSVLLVPGEKINILEALASAGDMTSFGRRENVVIIRTRKDVRSTARVNLNEKSLLNSPFFYLQQNDIVYVAPKKAKSLQASTSTYRLPIWLSLASLVAFIVSTFR